MRVVVSITASIVLLSAAFAFLFELPDRTAVERDADQLSTAEPIRTAAGVELERLTTELPDGSVVVHVKDAERISPPFELVANASAVGGTALLAPVGSPAEGRGRARLSVELPRPGTYHAWVRGLWRDECSNTVCLTVGSSPERVAGGDSVYNVWHWVPVATFELAESTVPLEVIQRETGAAVDQILLTPDGQFQPVGPILAGRMQAGVRRFADGFERSPGHGLGDWDIVSGEWEIRFSYDPNRIDNQYSLAGHAKGGPAVIYAGDRPWKGCRLDFSFFPPGPGRYGAILDDGDGDRPPLIVEFDVIEGETTLVIEGPETAHSQTLDQRIRVDQWHRISIERWAWMLDVSVDGEQVVSLTDLEPSTGRVGLRVAQGEGIFDDAAVTEIPWVADDGETQRITWIVADDASWTRPNNEEVALIGERGTIRSPDIGLPVREVMTDTRAGIKFHQPTRPVHFTEFSAGRTPLRLHRVAISYGKDKPDYYRIGPYHFTEPRIEDPSDYLDFTDEEWEEMRESPDADTLRRRQQYIPLVGRGDNAVWVQRGGHWRVAGGRLAGRGPNAELIYSQRMVSDFVLRFTMKLEEDAVAEWALYAGDEGGVPVRFSAVPPDEDYAGIHLELPDDGEWHQVTVRTKGTQIEARVGDGPPKSATFARHDAGAVLLRILDGRAFFDDIEFLVPREQPGGMLYAFDRRETDWWRTGKQWQDHAGVACAIASNWISLIAPEGDGVLWNKRTFGPDVLVAFNIEENTEWFGWSQRPSHVHYPFDNICLHLAADEDEPGYRLEVNARDRTATVLYRQGEEVAVVEQDGTFPIRYVGGHAPYRPRRNHISLSKRGDDIRVLINEVEVLRWTDPDPLPVGRIGIGGYQTRVNFSHIEIRDLSE